MPNVKSLLKKALPEVAVRQRTCKNSGEPILKGNRCLVVFDGPRDRFCYSQEIGLLMIAKARTELDRIERTLTGTA